MKLNKLLERLEYDVVQGTDEAEVTTLVNDSRKVEDGSVFVCISGARDKGKDNDNLYDPFHPGGSGAQSRADRNYRGDHRG